VNKTKRTVCEWRFT